MGLPTGQHWIRVIDSHTGGEPTRVVIQGGPELGNGSVAEQRKIFQEHHDAFRSAVVNEPRGSEVMVGALLCPPVDSSSATGVVFFNNVGPLWMCGHATIGVGVTLGHLGRIGAGIHRLETAVGPVTIDFDGANRVSFQNVPSFRLGSRTAIEVDGLGIVTGEIAWGGNWFFLVSAENLISAVEHSPSLRISVPFSAREIDRLTELAWRIRAALTRDGVKGQDGNVIDHIEFSGPPVDPVNHCRNFVLCPGRAYDRSPCGTGTSAKLACLAAEGQLQPGEIWRQESILGSVFEGSYQWAGEQIIPRITGSAYITAEATLILDPADPFQMGIASSVTTF